MKGRLQEGSLLWLTLPCPPATGGPCAPPAARTSRSRARRWGRSHRPGTPPPASPPTPPRSSSPATLEWVKAIPKSSQSPYCLTCNLCGSGCTRHWQAALPKGGQRHHWPPSSRSNCSHRAAYSRPEIP
eukprot:scaffold45559_cov18-Prasinocladus_malaysianus.AAC.1